MAKIAITGHTAGIGKAFADIYASKGHEIIGLSKRNGYNIYNLPKVAQMIKPCDIFINNAQAGFCQTELLFAIHEAWYGEYNKKIINIGTLMTSDPAPRETKNYNHALYYTQKKALEIGISQLRAFNNWPKLCLVKPGAIATQPGQQTPKPYADVDQWAKRIVEILEIDSELDVEEISLGVCW